MILGISQEWIWRRAVCHAPYAFVGVDYETRTYISEKIALFGSADDFAGTGN